MVDVPRESYRIFTGPTGQKLMAAIDKRGRVYPLKPQAVHKRLADGYYDYNLKLIRLSPKPTTKALTFSQALAKGYPEFDPDQPRDDGGRFSGGGSADAATRDPRDTLARSLGLSELYRAVRSAKTPTARENARVKLDKELARAASKLTAQRLKAMSAGNRKTIADKVLPAMTSRQRGLVARALGVENEFTAVGDALHGKTKVSIAESGRAYDILQRDALNVTRAEWKWLAGHFQRVGNDAAAQAARHNMKTAPLKATTPEKPRRSRRAR